MKKLLLLICLAAMALSCKKNKQEVPPVVSGAITGSIEPAGNVSIVYATDDLGKQVSATVDPGTGSFKIEQLAAGNYRLALPPSMIYHPLIGLSVTVLNGETTDTGVIGLTMNNPLDPIISGYLLPAGFGTTVTAKESTSGKVYTTVPDAAGFFLLNLPDGNYNISFGAKAPLEAARDINITVASKSLNLGNINCKEGSSGSITGKISPQYGATSVKATNVATGSFSLGTIDYTKGTFNFPVMLPGSYQISFAVNPPYLVPADRNADVMTGKATDLGTVTLVYDKDIRVLSYKINGSGKTRYNQSCNFNGDILSFSLLSITMGGGIPENIKTTHSTFNLTATGITGPGKYPLNGSNSTNITLTEVTSSNASLNKVTTNWSISSISPVGGLEVNAIDRTARTIRGTFSATLVADKNGVANKVVTEGNFFLDY